MKKADWLGTLKPKNDVPGFPFSLIYPRLGAGEAGNPEMPTGAEKNCSKKSPFSLAKGLGKGQSGKIENLQTMTTLLKPNTTENTEPYPP